MPESARGALVTVEGIDGTGKSSVVEALGRWLAAKGVRAAVQREPTSSWLGEAVRRAQVAKTTPLGHMFLFLADRADHVRAMRDEVALGATVLCDRYFDSTVAYQGAALKGAMPAEPPDVVQWIRELHKPWVLVPDLTLLLVDDPATCVERLRRQRGHTSMFEDPAYLARVQDVYRRLAAEEPARFRVIEGGPLDGVTARAQAELEAFLGQRGLLRAAAP